LIETKTISTNQQSKTMPETAFLAEILFLHSTMEILQGVMIWCIIQSSKGALPLGPRISRIKCIARMHKMPLGVMIWCIIQSSKGALLVGPRISSIKCIARMHKIPYYNSWTISMSSEK
jgi:hypothetical protein